jgi:L-asparaginase
MNAASRIVLLSTGGTIGERDNPATGCLHASGEDLLASAGVAGEVHVENLFDLPSTFIGLPEMLRIAEAVAAAFRNGADAVVVTHGTDTLEETAFFVDLQHDDERPVVLTAAMLPDGVAGTDGVRNLRHAFLAAASPQLCGLGAVVVMEAEIHAARDVTKFHSTSLGAFKSPEFGPLGSIDEDRIFVARRPARRTILPTTRRVGYVEAVKCYAGMSDCFVRAAIAAAPDGLVIETLGSGQVPPVLMPAIREAMAAGIGIVATPRSPAGRLIRDHYEQPQRVTGDERDLRDAGVIFANLQGPKARIQLALAKGAGIAGEHLRRLFEEAEPDR